MRFDAQIVVLLALAALTGCQPGSGVQVTTEVLTTLAAHCDVSGSVPGAIAFHCQPNPPGGTTTVNLPVNVGLVAVPAR